MSDRYHRIRAFMLVELMIVIAATAGILFLMGKYLVDGIYLQRIAAEHADRVATTSVLMRRLRADGLGAVAYDWVEESSGPALLLRTYGDGSPREVRYVFEPDCVARYEAGHEAGAFYAPRLRFSAHIERETRSDMLAVDLIVSPPARARWRPVRVSSEHVLLPHRLVELGERPPQPDSPTSGEQQP